MGRRLGMVHHQKITEEEWYKLVLYFLSKAPDSLNTPHISYSSLQSRGYSVNPLNTPTELSNVISYLDIDSDNGDLVIGDAVNNSLIFFNSTSNSNKVFHFQSPIIGLSRKADRYYVSTIGIMPPNDDLKGKVMEFNPATNQRKVLIDSLRRPVEVTFHDFNRDDLPELLICEYGNNFGQLSLYSKLNNDTYQKKTLIQSTGAIKTIITDFNDNGRDDILVLFAQGDERIELLINKGNKKFTRNILLRFPPVYGSFDMEWADINGDGSKEILYTNGDNGDISNVLKPYHGLHIFEKVGKYNFKEHFFAPFYGASKIEIADLDGDSDPDIFVTSTYPAKKGYKSPGITLFDNESTTEQFSLTPYQVSESLGRSFAVLRKGDFDGDGKDEIVAGALDISYYLLGPKGSDSNTKLPSLYTISYP